VKRYQYLLSTIVVDFFHMLLDVHVRDRSTFIIATRIFASFDKFLSVLAPPHLIARFPIARENDDSKTCGVLLRRVASQARQSGCILRCSRPCFCRYYSHSLFSSAWCFAFVLFFFVFLFFQNFIGIVKIQQRRESSFARALFVFLLQVLARGRQRQRRRRRRRRRRLFLFLFLVISKR